MRMDRPSKWFSDFSQPQNLSFIHAPNPKYLRKKKHETVAVESRGQGTGLIHSGERQTPWTESEKPRSRPEGKLRPGEVKCPP